MSDATETTAALDAVTGEVMDEATAQSGGTDVMALIASLNSPDGGFWTSIKSADDASRDAVFAALTDAQRVDDNFGKTINLVHAVVLPVDINTDEGEVNTAPRVTLIDADGTAYVGTSLGLLSSLRTLLSIYGEPETWSGPKAIQVTQERTRKGFKVFNIKPATVAAPKK